jgi:hypothetical protein
MSGYTDHERAIARSLGVSPTMLTILFRLRRGDLITGNNSGTALAKRGLVTEDYPRRLTPAGERVAEQARAAGW